MKKDLLFSKFFQAINWNLLLYIFYKICFITVSYKLYSKISSFYFSQWAMGNAIVFLVLLLIDPGFKKSIPRFYPLFAQDDYYYNRFIIGIITTQILILIAALIGFLHVISLFIKIPELYNILGMLFLIEGIGGVFQTIYHAHFKNKQFNFFNIMCTLLEMISNIYFIMTINNELDLIKALFITKIISGIMLILCSLFFIFQLNNDHLITKYPLKNGKKIIHDFIIHSLLMWASTAIKALTERNALFPYITHIFGENIGNDFKIAHDSALFFQRIGIKSLGSADTSLLSYTYIKSNKNKDLRQSFDIIVKIISWITLLLGLLSILVFFLRYTELSHKISALFYIVVIGYIIEIYLSPYERILEVKQEYKKLWTAYIPYLFIIIGLFLIQFFTKFSINLFSLLVIIHSSRILSSLIFTYYGKLSLYKNTN